MNGTLIKSIAMAIFGALSVSIAVFIMAEHNPNDVTDFIWYAVIVVFTGGVLVTVQHVYNLFENLISEIEAFRRKRNV